MKRPQANAQVTVVAYGLRVPVPGYVVHTPKLTTFDVRLVGEDSITFRVWVDQEGVRWIRGWHTAESAKSRALLAASMLAV